MAHGNRALLTGVVIVIVALSAAFLYAFFTRGGQEQREKLLSDGLAAWQSGDFANSRAAFEEAARMSPLSDERAQYETLIASTYERTDLARSVELYQAAMNNVGYSLKARALAATYLLLALSNNYDPAVAGSVFSESPWEGLYTNDTGTPRVDYEIAIARGYQWILLNLGPNFLAHLGAGEFYARMYAISRESSRAITGPRIPAYYQMGVSELLEAQQSGAWHPNLIAIGLRERAMYADAYARLVRSGLLPAAEPAISDNDVDRYYKEFESYVDTNVAANQRGALALPGLINHAQFLLSLENADAKQLTVIGDRLAITLEDDGLANTVRIYGLAPTLQFEQYRKTLVSLASSYSPSLKQALLNRVPSFTAQDFLTE